MTLAIDVLRTGTPQCSPGHPYVIISCATSDIWKIISVEFAFDYRFQWSNYDLFLRKVILALL